MQNLPSEILTHIYEYSSERPIKNILNDIIRESIFHKYKNYKYYYSYDPYKLHEECNTSVAIEGLITCNCCKKHKSFRPKNANDISWFYASLNIGPKIKKYKSNCKCSCRHLSRSLQRHQIRKKYDLHFND